LHLILIEKKMKIVESANVKEFLGEVVSSLQSLNTTHYSDPLLKQILYALPRDGTEIERGIQNLQELKNSLVSEEMELNQSQDIVQAGGRRGTKRLLSDSDDEKDPSQTKHIKHSKVENDENMPPQNSGSQFVCPKEKPFFESMESSNDLNRYKETKEYQDVIGNQTLRRSKEGRKLILMVEAQEKVFQALDELAKKDGDETLFVTPKQRREAVKAFELEDLSDLSGKGIYYVCNHSP
jgi:hypothetical protein